MWSGHGQWGRLEGSGAAMGLASPYGSGTAVLRGSCGAAMGQLWGDHGAEHTFPVGNVLWLLLPEYG